MSKLICLILKNCLDCDVPTTQSPAEGELQENGALPSRGNDNGGLRQFEENENDGIVPHLLLNTLSHRNP